MDAVGLPLPLNVQVDKFMASDGSNRVGEVEFKSSVFQKGSHCAPSRAEYVSSSRNKKVDNDSYMHEDIASFSVYGDHNKGHHLELNDEGAQLLPNHKGKFIRRKSAKKLVNTSFKRLHDGESECCNKNAGNFGREAISNEVECDSSRCTFDDKNLTPKQRRVHDGKRIDKKNFRSTMKNKYECLISKTALSCSDTFASGNTIADFSSEVFSAAIILNGMADCSDVRKAAKTNNGKMRWPKTPSMKTMRAHKSSHSVDKQDGFSADARRHDLIKRARIQCARRADFLHHTPRCSSTPLGAASFPTRSEKHLSQANPIRAPLSTQSSSRADKACDQVRKMPAKPPSAAAGGSYIKDWIRSRSKKL